MFDDGYPTRPVDQKGAHVGGCGAGWNQRSFGVTLAGGLDPAGKPVNNFSKKQFRSLTVSNLRAINGLQGDVLQPGQELKLA